MNTPSSPSEALHLAGLAGELRISVSKLMRRMREQTHPNDLTPSQKSVLLRLDRDGAATVSALARAESVRPQSMRMTVATLESMGAVSGAPDPTDGRQTLIALTPAFRKRLQANRAAKDDWLFRALHAQLSTHEQAELAAAVQLLQRLAEFHDGAPVHPVDLPGGRSA
ncbi:MarR family winged helix-turn-helix transcriptional regulator [Burkholderia anthina]|uniref:MarR family winged helix-turn-helix transcriptional regulator n=1 Tax=Burkholderia anthina TaxID=179879 RepID=UPI00158E2B61|nr:MarR family transcriptional regulator [Burkholderia anthina]